MQIYRDMTLTLVQDNMYFRGGKNNGLPLLERSFIILRFCSSMKPPPPWMPRANATFKMALRKRPRVGRPSSLHIDSRRWIISPIKLLSSMVDVSLKKVGELIGGDKGIWITENGFRYPWSLDLKTRWLLCGTCEISTDWRWFGIGWLGCRRE